jgi:hypothetical protein
MYARSLCAVVIAFLLNAEPARGQHDTALPTSPAQAAFATIREVVAILKNDPATDWSKVDIEALRQHLIDMDDVVIRSTVVSRNIPGGVELNVTGTGRTIRSIRGMVSMHSTMLDPNADYETSVAEVPSGMRVTVTAKDKRNAAIVARVRGLGFLGLMTDGDHHAAHHIMIARGLGHGGKN